MRAIHRRRRLGQRHPRRQAAMQHQPGHRLAVQRQGGEPEGPGQQALLLQHTQRAGGCEDGGIGVVPGRRIDEGLPHLRPPGGAVDPAARRLRVMQDAHHGVVHGQQGVARCLDRLARHDRAGVVEPGVAQLHRGAQLRRDAIALGQHALGPAAVAEAGIGQMLAGEPRLHALQPELHILPALAQGGVVAQAGVQHAAAQQAAGLAVIVQQQRQWREFTRGIGAVPDAEAVDIGVEPPGLRRRRIEQRQAALEETRQDAVVGIEHVDAARLREGRESMVDAAVARGREPAIAGVQGMDAAGVAARGLERDLAGFRHRATVIDHDGGHAGQGLRHDALQRLGQQSGLPEGRDHAGDLDCRGIHVARSTSRRAAPWLRSARTACGTSSVSSVAISRQRMASGANQPWAARAARARGKRPAP